MRRKDEDTDVRDTGLSKAPPPTSRAHPAPAHLTTRTTSCPHSKSLRTTRIASNGAGTPCFVPETPHCPPVREPPPWRRSRPSLLPTPRPSAPHRPPPTTRCPVSPTSSTRLPTASPSPLLAPHHPLPSNPRGTHHPTHLNAPLRYAVARRASPPSPFPHPSDDGATTRNGCRARIPFPLRWKKPDRRNDASSTHSQP